MRHQDFTPPRREARLEGRTRDPRDYQVVALSTLLAVGITRFGFDVPVSHVAFTLTTALAGQWWAQRVGWPATPAARDTMSSDAGGHAARAQARAPRVSAFQYKS